MHRTVAVILAVLWLGDGLYCLLAGFMKWPLTNVVWMGASLGFLAASRMVLADIKEQ